MRARLPLASLAALAWAEAAAAQPMPTLPENGGPPAEAMAPVTTVIIPDAEAALDLGTRVTENGNVRVIDGGTLAGRNLFHSFNRFDLGRGDFARWVHSAGDPAAIVNVINRVTGGDPSNIGGEIDSSALPNAGFWFINPAGVLFGEGARLNVPTAAHFATAHELRFASGPTFTIATPGSSTFSVAAPNAFGFLGGQGTVSIAGVAGDFLAPGASLTLAGSDVSISSSTFATPSLSLYAVGSEAVEIAPGAALPTGLGGRATIENSVVLLTGIEGGGGGLRISAGATEVARSRIGTSAGQGSIALQGGDILISRSFLGSATEGAADAGDITLAGTSLRIQGSFLTSEAGFGATGAAGDISLLADRITIEDGSFVTTSTLSDQPGGSILIEGSEIDVAFSVISSSSAGLASGQSGSIDINGGQLTLREDALISSGTSGDGAGGPLSIAMDRFIHMDRGVISSAANGEGRSGGGSLLTIRTPELRLTNDSAISTSTVGDGAGGIIAIGADDILLQNGSRIEARATFGSSGDAGLVLILGLSGEGGRLALESGSSIRSDTAGSGDAGGISIEIGEVTLSEGTRISSDAELPEGAPEGSVVTGSAGNIGIVADRITVASEPRGGGAYIQTESRGSGSAGTIELDVGALVISGDAHLSALTSGSGGGGRILVNADTVSVSDRADITSTAFGTGTPGTIELNVTGSVVLERGARVSSETSFSSSSGVGGAIRIVAPDIQLLVFSEITTSTGGPGSAGTIDLAADRLLITENSKVSSEAFGSGPAGSISIAGGTMRLDQQALVTSATFGSGAGGSISIDVGDLIVAGGAIIDADTLGFPEEGRAGAAGNITIKAGRLAILGTDELPGPIASRISSSTVNDADAGNIVIMAGELIMDQGQILSQTRSTGNAGSVSISGGRVLMENGAQIGTSTQPCLTDCSEQAGNAGEVRFDVAGALQLLSSSQISSAAGGTGNAGTIGIAAGSVILGPASRITSGTDPRSTGASGQIAIQTGPLLVNNGVIQTNSNNANEAGGILIEASRIVATGADAAISSANDFAGGGDAGGIFITTGNMALLDGARLTTSSLMGAAGSIEVFMPATGLLRLESRGAPSLITTSSGPGTGGRIFIGNPLAIISNGGTILALGEQGGANVEISTDFFIRSSDRLNRVAVDGDFLLDAAVSDVSSGTANRDLSVLDASGVLRGQCASARATGQVSQLVVRPIGPYGNRAAPAAPPPVQEGAGGAGSTGTCF